MTGKQSGGDMNDTEKKRIDILNDYFNLINLNIVFFIHYL
jgi:hypothetical protein